MIGSSLGRTLEPIFRELISMEGARPADGEWPRQLWGALVDTGLTRAGVAESNGGEGGTTQEAAIILWLSGYFALPLPIAENGLLAGWMLAGTDMSITRSELTTVAPGHVDDRLEVRRRRDRWEVSDCLHRVPFAEHAEQVLALGSEGAVLAIPRQSYNVIAGLNVAGECRDTITIEHATVLGSQTGRSQRELRSRGALTRSVLIAGCLERVLAMSIQYAGDRVQFGKPIAKFQAVGHLLARLAEQSALASVAAELAHRSFDDGAQEAGVVKSVSGHAATTGARIAHQVHGAIGVTQEYDLQMYSRRLLSWRDEYGSEAAWEAEIGRTLLEAGAAAAWDSVIGAHLYPERSHLRTSP